MQISLVAVCIKPECWYTVKGEFAEGNTLIRQGFPGALQNMQRTVTVSWSAINGLTNDAKAYADKTMSVSMKKR